MKFQVPQFIQTESKLIGPFTLKQFMWIAAGAAALTLAYIITQGPLFFLLAAPIAAFSIGFAFVKIDGIPLINYVTYVLSYVLNPKKYTYQKEQTPLYENLPQPQEEQPDKL